MTSGEYQRLCALTPEANTKHRLTESERERYARSTSLHSFFLQCREGRWGKVGRKREKSAATWAGYRDAIKMWCDYTRPMSLSEEMDWPGLNLETIERLSAEQWQEIVDLMAEDVAAATVGRRWRELLVFLRMAVKVNAMRWFAMPDLPPEDDLKRVYSPDEVARLWKLLAPHSLLQSALVVSLNCGLRTSDLLGLPWTALQKDVVGRSVLEFKAKKTGKQQRLPLAPVTVAAIERCRPITSHSPWMFWGLTNPAAKYPERTVFAQARRQLQREIWEWADIRDLRKPDQIVNKPWQVGRATCATRYDTFHLGVGSFVLAHALQGVTARSYTEPTQLVWDAVLKVPQYDCFNELL